PESSTSLSSPGGNPAPSGEAGDDAESCEGPGGCGPGGVRAGPTTTAMTGARKAGPPPPAPSRDRPRPGRCSTSRPLGSTASSSGGSGGPGAPGSPGPAAGSPRLPPAPTAGGRGRPAAAGSPRPVGRHARPSHRPDAGRPVDHVQPLQGLEAVVEELVLGST